MQTLNQRDSGRDIEHRFADKGTRDRRAILGWATRPARWRGHIGFPTEGVEEDDQLLALWRDRSDLLGDVREQPALPSDPAPDIPHCIVAHGLPPSPIEI